MTCSSLIKDNTFNSLEAAVSASAAFALLITSGLSCSFLEIRSRPGDLLMTLENSLQVARTSSNLGILCEGDGFYDVSDEPMHMYSLIFFIGACVAGSASCLLAWAVSFGYSKPYLWQCISGLSAVSSLLQLPMFLLFEIEVCTEYTEEQQCFLDMGSYLLIASTGCWVLTTLITQCFDPPDFLEHWRATHNKNSRIIPDIEHGRLQRPHSETQRSRSSESQRSRISQQNAPRLAHVISTNSVQPSLVMRSVVDWDHSSAMPSLHQTSVGTSEVDPPSVNYYPAGVATAGFTQLSFANQTTRSELLSPHALFSTHPSQIPTTESYPSTTVLPLHSVSPDARSHVSDLQSVGVSVSTRRSKGTQVESDLEELITRAVRKSIRGHLYPVQSNEVSNEKVKSVEEEKRNSSPLTLGSLDTDNEAGDESILGLSIKSGDRLPLLGTDESKNEGFSRNQNQVPKRDVNRGSEERKQQQHRPQDESRGNRTKPLSNRSWKRTGMKYLRVCDDSHSEPNSPPLEISINMEEGDDFILEPIEATDDNHRNFHVITPDAKDIWRINNTERSGGSVVMKHHDDRRGWGEGIFRVKSVDGRLENGVYAVPKGGPTSKGHFAPKQSNRQHVASSASVASAPSYRLRDYDAPYQSKRQQIASSASVASAPSYRTRGHVAPQQSNRQQIASSASVASAPSYRLRGHDAPMKSNTQHIVSSASVASVPSYRLRGHDAPKKSNNRHTASSASVVSAPSYPLSTTVQERQRAIANGVELDRERFDPSVARRPMQRSLSTPTMYGAPPVSTSRPPKTPEQMYSNLEKSPRSEPDFISRPPKAPVYGYSNREESPRRELDKPPRIRSSSVPRKAGKSSLTQGRETEVSSLMSEELLGHRVENWGSVRSDRTHLRSRSVPRGAIETTPNLWKGASMSFDEIIGGAPVKANSIFRQERDERAGIHAPAVITADICDEDDISVVSSKSQLARKAREARLRRLAASRSSSRTRFESEPVVLSNTQLVEKARAARAKRLAAMRPSNQLSRGRSNSSSCIGDMMYTKSVSAEYGPEENSV